MLWCCNLFRSVQLMWKVSKQVCICPEAWPWSLVLTNNSMATRIAYAFILLINSIISWIMLTPWALKRLEHLTLDYMTLCEGENCYGFVAVQRINFALFMFHAILAITLLGVRNTKDGRAALQNGFWGPKIIVWILFIVVSFFMPETFFSVWGHYIAFAGAMLFLLLGLILLVDLAHTWAELCLRKIDEEESRVWRGLLIGSTLGMYLASIAMTIVMYIYFAGSGCSMNQAAITVRFLSLILSKLMYTDIALGQPYHLPDHLLHLCTTCGARIQSKSRSCSSCHGHNLLHLPDIFCCCDGTG